MELELFQNLWGSVSCQELNPSIVRKPNYFVQKTAVYAVTVEFVGDIHLYMFNMPRF